MESKLHIIRKKKNDLENSRLDPLMRALKALHSAGAPENMTAEELERQRRSQEVLGRLTAPMAGMDYEEFALSGMSAAWTRLKAPHGAATRSSIATAAATQAATLAIRAYCPPSSPMRQATTC